MGGLVGVLGGGGAVWDVPGDQVDVALLKET